MHIVLKINGETTRYTNELTKRKLTSRNSRFRAKVGNSKGTCTVIYGKGYENEFDYDGWDDFEYKLLPCLEEELVDEFKATS